MRRWVVAAIAASLLTTTAGCEIQSAHERTYGGDAIKIAVEFRFADDQQTFQLATVALGAPPDKQRGIIPGDQAVVVKFIWTDSAYEDGSFELIALDKRVITPIPLLGDGGWSTDGPENALRHSSYDTLAKRYDWLAELGWTQLPDGSKAQQYGNPAVGSRASRAGTLTAWWFTSKDRPRLTNPDSDIALALIYADRDGALQWARRIAG